MLSGMNPGFSRTAVCFFAVALATTAAIADDPKFPAAEPAATIVPTEYLVLPLLEKPGRVGDLIPGRLSRPPQQVTMAKMDLW